MRAVSHIATDSDQLRAWLDAGVSTAATATFVTGSSTVTASTGSVSRTTSTAAVLGLFVRMDKQEGIVGSDAGALSGGVTGIDAIYWVETPTGNTFDNRTSLVIGAETFDVAGFGDFPGLDGTKLLYLRRRS